MADQRVGVEAVFIVNQFTRGVNRYLSGLDRATRATLAATQAVNRHNQSLRGIRSATQPAAQAIQSYSQATTRATRSTREFGVAGVAIGTAIGQVAVGAVRAFTQAAGRLTRQLGDTIQFFERLDISIEFFNARAVTAADSTLSFEEALAQGAVEAEGLSFWLRQLAIASPFTTRDVGTLFRVSQAYGLTREEAELLTPGLLDLAAAGGFTSDVLERVALAVGQIRARGKLTGEEVRQLGNSGIPIRDILVESLGFANDEFDELLEAGELTSDVVLPAIIQQLERFEGASERISFGTITGIISAFQEFIEIASAEFFIAALSNLTDLFAEFFEVLNDSSVIAFITVLGEELGVFLRETLINATQAIRGSIEAWNALDPILQRQIIVFGATLVATTALVGAIGLLVLAINTLINPFTVATLAFSLFISEYSVGFRNLRAIAAPVTSEVSGSFESIADSAEENSARVGESFAEFSQILSGASNAAAAFGEQFSTFLAGNFANVQRLSTVVANLLGSLFTGARRQVEGNIQAFRTLGDVSDQVFGFISSRIEAATSFWVSILGAFSTTTINSFRNVGGAVDTLIDAITETVSSGVSFWVRLGDDFSTLFVTSFSEVITSAQNIVAILTNSFQQGVALWTQLLSSFANAFAENLQDVVAGETIFAIMTQDIALVFSLLETFASSFSTLITGTFRALASEVSNIVSVITSTITAGVSLWIGAVSLFSITSSNNIRSISSGIDGVIGAITDSIRSGSILWTATISAFTAEAERVFATVGSVFDFIVDRISNNIAIAARLWLIGMDAIISVLNDATIRIAANIDVWNQLFDDAISALSQRFLSQFDPIRSVLSAITGQIQFNADIWTTIISDFGGFYIAVLDDVEGAIERFVGTAVRRFTIAFRTGEQIASEFARFVLGVFGDVAGGIADFGTDAIRTFADGISAGFSVIGSVLSRINSIFSFWLAPGSPPRAVPLIDQWGAGLAQEYANSFADSDIGGIVARFGERVDEEVQDVDISPLPVPPIDIGDPVTSSRVAIPPLNINQSPFASSLPDQIRTVTEDSIEEGTSEAEGAAEEAGIRISEEFIDGFLREIPSLEAPANKELQEVLSRIGGGRELTFDAAFRIGDFVADFEASDFDALSTAQRFLQDALRAQVDTGEIDALDLPRLLFGGQETITRALEQFREIGSISEGTFNQIRQSAGRAGGLIVEFLQDYTELAEASEATEEAQSRLNEVTERYEKILTPVREELEAINEQVKFTDEQQRIASLQRLIQNQGVSFGRRQAAIAEIQQIQAERRLRTLEAERDEAVGGAEEELSAREKQQAQLEEQFSLMERRIGLQLEQVGLVGEEASMIQRLNEEAARLAEKRTEELDLQHELLKLQESELDDLLTATRAKLVLEDEDSTALERQQALIDLQTVAINRRNREAKAIDLGIPLDELTRLRELLVMPSDLGDTGAGADEEGEGGGRFDDVIQDINDGLVDAEALGREFNETLNDTRDRWIEIREQIQLTAQEINENLPIPLQFFPGEPGEEPPVIGTLRNIGVILGVLAASKAVKVIGSLFASLNPLTVAIIALALTWENNIGGIQRTTREGFDNLKEDFDSVGEFLGNLQEGFALFADGVSALFEGQSFSQLIFGEGGADSFIQVIQSVIDFFADEEKRKELFEAVQGFIHEISRALTLSRRDLGGAGGPIGSFILTAFRIGAESDSAGDIIESGKSAGRVFLDGVKEEIDSDEDTGNEAGSRIGGGILNGIRNFLSGEDAATEATNAGKGLGGSVRQGISEGISEDEEEAKQGIGQFLLNLIGAGESAIGAESPSTVARDRIGIPFGQGIINGISGVIDDSSGNIASVFTSMADTLARTARDLRIDIVRQFNTLNTALVPILATSDRQIVDAYTTIAEDVLEEIIDLRADSLLEWEGMREDSIEELETLRTDAVIELGNLSTSLSTALNAIKDLVVGIFQDMRLDSEEEVILLRDNIVGLFVGEEDSLLSLLREGLLGEGQSIPVGIGEDFMQGIARGITENQNLVSESLSSALAFALESAADEIEAESPSRVAADQLGGPIASGVAEGILSGFSQVADATIALMSHAISAPMREQNMLRQIPSSVTNVSNVTDARQFNLNVNSGQSSQGVISDFTILQSMAG